MAEPLPDDAVSHFVDANFDEAVLGEDGLAGWLRIPSVSADPAHAADVVASARWLVEALRRTGFPTVETWPTPGAPAVYAHWPARDAGAPRVLVYGHHDVQPADPFEAWRTPPFEATVVGEELFARGAIDDKGQVIAHLLGLRAHLAATGADAPAVDLTLLVEGEEESGSPHFAELLRARADRLRPDVVIVSDTSVFARDTPSICTGMRGLIDCEITVTGAEGDLHSGSFGGGVPNPLTALARLLATLHDDDGRVTLDGFYDRVVPLSPRERELFARLPFDEGRWVTATAHARAAAGERGFSTLERIWARPTAEINGMWGGYTGPGGKTIVPASAHAKLSFRLVSDQRPEEVAGAVRRWVAGLGDVEGLGAEVSFSGPGVRPCLTPLDAPALRAASRAMERAFGREVLYTREGGSGPEADLAAILGAPVVFMGVGLPDDRIHAPNERVVLPMLRAGARAVAYLWDELAVGAAEAAEAAE
jgi:acetylornithine deacetylase/succinyl-diaminopimelate desuccinylase-like protein